ncbi:peptidoglycan-binding protein [Phytomonospora endophytica]|uniref:Peptidoglycan hydrolase-like protein with peptidoglycan-binding domain n=1 Tax=Phytomonospora endophytica TaxID=714109 RepID=A0A841FLU3_9ACTN|nr:peptidoglycan-binding protein [Phytomonospora endophytica]MBB6037126.1 peptidoglycan hydrolase-like protein with peptidoglycan-binding domain [Phytomonospora endophytica]GIG71165.1 peptidoglycan-binding protein [Phytomonospora endophytica]
MRGRIWAAGGAAVVVVAGAVVVALGAFGGDGEAASTDLPPGTTEVRRQDLTRTERVDGTLTYGEATPLSGSLPGTVTWLPAAGATVRRGKALYKVDDDAVVVMYGLLPLWRELSPGTSGPDVRQLEENLEALGYTGLTVDSDYTGATADAVRAWQDDAGLPETGTVAPGRVVFADGAARVAELSVAVGGPASGPVLTYTGGKREVRVDLDVADQDLVKKGLGVAVTLPDGSTVDAEVARIGTAVQSGEAATGGEDGADTIEVNVSIKDQKALGSLDSAPVTVELTAETREDVLVVPVEALLALREGGYGLQLVEGGSTRIVAVTAGMFASGLVEVSGEGLAEGVLVGLPS